MTLALPTAESLLLSTLCQITLIIGFARVCATSARVFGQPGAVGEILAGLILGPSVLGHLAPGLSLTVFSRATSGAITIISQIGLILLMFQIGTQFDFSHLRAPQHRTATIRIALASIATPFALGWAFGLFSAATLAPGSDRVVYSLFCGVAVAITAVPILGRILQEFGLTRDPIGAIAIAAAAINDIAGWLLLACLSAYTTSNLSGTYVLWRCAALVTGAAFLFWVIQPLVNRLLKHYPIQAGTIPANLMAIVLCLIFGLGMCTSAIGIFTIFGGFAAGLLFHRNHDFVEAWRHQVGQFVLVFFLPIFFTFTGLRTDVLGLSTLTDFGWLALVLAASVLGKIVPVYLAGRMSGLGHGPSSVLGAMMNTRALMELIVLNVGYNLGVLPQKVFTMLVIMAVTTTIMTGPLLRHLLPRMGYAIPPGVDA